MAIERIQQPNRWSAVYSPIIYKFRSTFDSGYKITTPVAPSVIGDSNGFLLVTFSGSHGLAAGDYAYIESDFSGVYRVIDCPGSAQAIFDADGTVGQNMVQAYKYAYKYMASVEVFAKINNSYTSIGTVTTKPVDDGTDIIFTFDVSGVLRSYISSNVPNLYGSGVQIAADAFKEYYIQYREEYIHGVNGVPQYEEFDWITDTDSSHYDTNEKVAVNATEQYTQQIGDPYKQSEYVFNFETTDTNFLTNQPDGLPYCNDRKYFIYFNNENQISGFFATYIKQYDSSGALLETDTETYAELPVGQHYVYIDSSRFTLNANCAYFTIDATAFDGFGSQGSQIIRFNVVNTDCDCSDNYYNVVWLNNKGGYSNFYFTGRATHGIDVDRQTPIKYNLLPSNFAPANRQYGNLRNVTRQRITLRHETTNKQVHEWLASELTQSIDVFMVRTVDGVDYLLPIVVDLDSVTLFKDKDKRYVFTCEALYGFELNTQTR